MKQCKVIALLLSALCLSQLAACGQDPGGGTADVTSSETTTAATEAPTRLDELGKKDFAGGKFRIIGVDGALPNFPEEEENGEIINDALYSRNAAIEGMYNIVIENTVDDKSATLFQNSVLAQEKEYELLVNSGMTIAPMALTGTLADLKEIPYLTFDAPWWSSLVYESCQIGGKLFYIDGDIAPVIYTAPGCFYMNNVLAEKYSIAKDSLYDTVLDGKWTLDYVYSLTKKLDQDINSDGKMTHEDDFFGFLNENNALSAGVLCVGSGVDLSGYDKDGNIKVGLMNEKTVAVIEKLERMVDKIPYTDNKVFHTAFKGDRALFFMHYTSSAYTRYRDMESDFSILPIPKYDESQASYRNMVNAWCNGFIALPSNVDAEKAGFICEAMAYYSRVNVRPSVYEDAFKIKGARDEKSALMLDLIFDNLYLDLNALYDFGGSVTGLGKAIFSDVAFASTYTSIEPKIAADIAKLTESKK